MTIWSTALTLLRNSALASLYAAILHSYKHRHCEACLGLTQPPRSAATPIFYITYEMFVRHSILGSERGPLKYMCQQHDIARTSEEYMCHVLVWRYTYCGECRGYRVFFFCYSQIGDEANAHTTPMYVYDTQYNQFTAKIPWIYV